MSESSERTEHEWTLSEEKSESKRASAAAADREDDSSGVAVAEPEEQTRPDQRADAMPPWKVLLHNDDVNIMEDVVRSIRELTVLSVEQAVKCMLEAHHRGVALLLVTHREHAELLQEQFASKQLTVTIEPDS